MVKPQMKWCFLMSQPIVEFKIRENTDPMYASYKTISFVEQIGFNKKRSQEIGIIISELGTNIIKYGVEGTIEIHLLAEKNGLKIIARDNGKGIMNVAYALKDNYTDEGPVFNEDGERRSKSSGVGLAAIKRLSNDINIITTKSGSVIECIIYP